MRTKQMACLALLVALAACTHEPEPETQPPPLPAPESMLPPEVLDQTWEWIGFTSPVEQLTIDAASNYTIQFSADGRIALKADCNRGFGTFRVTTDRTIEIQPLGLTRAQCPPGSLGDRFVRELEQARIYFMKDGDFFLDKPMDSGTLRFRRQQ